MSYYDKTKLGRIISRCTSDITRCARSTSGASGKIVAKRLMMLVAAAMLLYTDWRLFLAVAGSGRSVLRQPRLPQARRHGMHQVAREGWTRVSTNLAENITGMRVVTAFNRQDPNLGVFNSPAGRQHRQQRARRAHQRRLPAAAQLIGFVGKVIILATAATWSSPPAGMQRRRRGRRGVYLYWDWFMNPILNFGDFLQPAHAGDGRRRARLQPARHEARRAPTCPAPAAAAHRRARDVRERHLRLQPRAPGAARHQLRSASPARCSPSSARPAAARAASSR
jgi:hypothetical protein